MCVFFMLYRKDIAWRKIMITVALHRSTYYILPFAEMDNIR